jgi:hypothetical protein
MRGLRRSIQFFDRAYHDLRDAMTPRVLLGSLEE